MFVCIYAFWDAKGVPMMIVLLLSLVVRLLCVVLYGIKIVTMFIVWLISFVVL